MTSPPPPPRDPRAPSQLEPTAVTFDPQGWTVVHPSTPGGGASAVAPGALSGGSQSKTAAPGALDDAVGTTLGPYHILGTVARGGQGVVYKARHRELGTLVALKLLLAHKDPRSVQLFRQEAQILARLRHPNVIVVTDLGEMMGVPFLAMDFVQGADLKSIVNTRGPLGIETARNLLAPIARTLQYCHDRGLVHRDVKPQNILIEEQTGRPILIDFGLVKRAEQFEKEYGELTTPMLSPVEMGGTPSFMAPEQTGAPGFGPTGPLSDVYGLGSTLYFLLTGKPPFAGAKTINTLNMVVSDPPVDPRQHRPDIPEPLAELCLWAMAKKAEERPPSAEDFARALKPEAAPEGDAAFYLERGRGRRDAGDLAGALIDLARAAELLAPGDALEKRVEEERLEVEAKLARGGGTSPAVRVAAAAAFLVLAGALAFALLRPRGPSVDVDDKSPPELAIAPVAEWDGGALAVSCTVRDKQPKSVRWQLVIDGRPSGPTFDAAVGPTGRVDARLDPAAVTTGTIGTLGVAAVAEDLVGNSSRAEVVVPIRRQPPRISIESPRDGLVTNDRSVRVRAIVGSARLRDAEVVLRFGDEERARLPLRVDGGDVSIDDLPLPDADGPCTIEVRSVDVVGNAGRGAVTIEVDRTPPDMTVIEPVGEWRVRDEELRVRVRTRDVSPLTVSVEGTALVVDANGEHGGVFRLRREGRNEGKIVARDAAGNERVATVVALRDTTPPRLLEARRTPGEAEVTAERLTVVLVTDESCSATVAGAPARADADGRTHTVEVPIGLGKSALAVMLTDPLGNSALLEPPELTVDHVLPPVLRPAWWTVAPAQKDHALEKQVPVAFTNALGMRFALVPPGTFRMGSPENEPGHDTDEFVHDVVLTRAFYMGAHEVTNAQFRRFKRDHDSGEFKGKSLRGDDQPAVNVTHAEATAFCRWLDEQAGVAGVHRLPTEAEWELACRAGVAGRFFWGTGPEGAAAFANAAGLEAATLVGLDEKDAFPAHDGWDVTAPAGKLKPNPFGLFDMLGNAAEWVSDRFKSYPSGSVTDPVGPPTGNHIVRGGSFAEGVARCRAAFRQSLSDGRHPTVGFRVVATEPTGQR